MGIRAESGENISFFCARRSFYYSKIGGTGLGLAFQSVVRVNEQ
jgi:hypothetical protein